MKKDQQLEKSDKLIVWIASLCALLLFSSLIYDVFFSSYGLQGHNKIGYISKIKNKVKRKASSSLIWYAAGDDESVYENDWIFTGDDSVAKISLAAGGEIVVEPGSLIILSQKNGLLELNLKHGRLLADIKTKNIQVNVVRKGRVEKIDTTRGPLQISQDPVESEPEVVALAKTDDSIPPLEEVAERKLYSPEEGFSEIETNGLSAELYHYKKVELYASESTTLPLNWSDPLGKWQKYEYQVGLDKEFSEVLTADIVETEGHEIKTQTAGIYHWRVRGLNDGSEVSDWTRPLISELDLSELKKSPPVQFAQHDIVFQLSQEEARNIASDRFYSLKPARPLTIDWTGEAKASQYLFQISDRNDFTNILVESIVDQPQFSVTRLKIGRSYFRVTPENEDGIVVGKSAVGRILTLLPAPASDSLTTIDNDTFQSLQWQAVNFAHTYEVQYDHARKGDFGQSAFANSARHEVPNKTGFLKWKVRVVDTKTTEPLSPFSKTVDWYDAAKRLASLHGTGQAGRLYPKITKPEARKTFISPSDEPLFIVMNWTYEKEALAYDVEISKSSDMSQLVYKKKVKNRKRAVIRQKLSPGIYYMRVRAKHETVTDESWSEPEIFRVIHRD